MITTRAAVVEEAGAPFTVQEVTLDEPRPTEVLVRMVAAGLCHTDLLVRAAGAPFRLPGVLGHEGAGVVERVGSAVTSVEPGDQVVLSFTSCGACVGCRDGHPAYCASWMAHNLLAGTRVDGSATLSRDGRPLGGRFFGQSSFAEYALADERSVVRVGPDADLAVLAPLGCGVLTGFGTVWNVLRPAPGQTLAVFGTGTVGLAAVMAAAQLPLVTVVGIDLLPERLALAAELGATHTVTAGKEDVAARLAEITGGRGVDAVVETTASPEVLRGAVDGLAVRGQCAVVGAPPPGTEVALDMQGLLTGKRVVGVTIGDADPAALIPRLIRLHQDGGLPLERLVRYYTLDELNRAAADMHQGRTVKPVIRFAAP
ncbi:NAD(P)-dependent alcohol dehydrogenase [Streptomyces sp. 4N509B]|uniref:NAD(P)-dependent alcohol dehydrogenase n=1 Tax=Streptomyces sp. 4N509B TaxID=3457413 RepID=UPI003FD6A8D3